MIPVWIKNKKTGRYDKIPYEMMSKGVHLYAGKPIWYACTYPQSCKELEEMILNNPKYFLDIGHCMYVFTGRKWRLHHRLINWFVGPRKYVLGIAQLMAAFAAIISLVIFGNLVARMF